jgi:predicted dehydrogenase/nucleoside-diphosphate-sugar epimerase
VTKAVLIGTGNIAAVHAQALALNPRASCLGVMDVNRKRAADFAKANRIDRVFEDLEEVLASNEVDAVHVLTPPDFHHLVALPALEAGKAVLVEKPIADTAAHGAEMVALAARDKTPLRTNQNFIFHPAHLKLKKALAANRIGPVRRAHVNYIMPLRQLAAGQFGHWMFASPLNLLLEQAVHPLSQLDDIMGPLTLETVTAGAKKEYANGIELVTSWQLGFSSPQGPAQMQIALGESFHDWSLEVHGGDGMVRADYLANRIISRSPGAYLDVIEDMRLGFGEGASAAGQALLETGRYFAAQARLLKRSDPFFRSIRASIDDFYMALRADSHDCDGARGQRLVELCEAIASKTPALRRPKAPRQWQSDEAKPVDCVVLGGTGFIGRAVVAKLMAEGKSVRVAARNMDNLPEDFANDRIEVAKGSASDGEFLDKIFKDAKTVINLAHGGGGDSYEEILKAMRGSALCVADAAQRAGVEKLLFVSSIAALYLGDKDKTIRHTTSPDLRADRRADYARAKVETEQALLQHFNSHGTPISIFRPGVVVGKGSSPFHSGVGLYNRERYCLGWNGGRNPLPFVLAEDVADALIRAAFDIPAGKLNGYTFNLIGDVRLTARDYTRELGYALGRPLKFRGQNIYIQHGGEIAKWVVKKIGGRNVPFPSLRDIKSRGMVSPFDIDFEKTNLQWQPVSDRQEFIKKAIEVHKG